MLGFDQTRSNVDAHYGGIDPESPDADYPGSPPTGVAKKGGVGMSYVFLMDFDTDGDNKISIEEWNEGFGNEPELEQQEEEDEEQQQEEQQEEQDIISVVT